MSSNAEFTFEQLVDWVEGRLSVSEAQAVEDQMALANETVQAQVRWLRALMSLRGVVMLAAPPAQVRATLTERFAQFTRQQAQPGFWQRLIAILTFDSALQPTLAGVRAGEASGARQFVFSVEPADVVLNLQPHPGEQKIDLLGQILPNNAATPLQTFAVQLQQGDQEIAIAMSDELGEFVFTALSPGNYELVLSADNLEIDVPSLALTA